MSTQPLAENGGRWHHLGGEKATRLTLADKNATILESEVTGHTYVLSYRYLTILRASAMGGDTFNVEVVWCYNNDIKLRQDEQEIRHLCGLRRSDIMR